MTLKVRKDIVKEVLAAAKKMAESRVLIGIPQASEARKGQPISNAALGYIHEFGAPEANIPARPFLIPGVRDAQAKAVAAMKRGAKKALQATGNASAAVRAGLNEAGLLAAAAVKRKITTGPFAPLSPNTLRQRDRKLIRQKGIKGAEKALKARKPLIDTGQMRNAVTYVVK